MCGASLRHWRLALLLMLAGAGYAGAWAKEPNDATSYEDFIEAAREAVMAEGAGRCADEGDPAQSCRETLQALIEEKAQKAYAEDLEEKAFRRRQAEDSADRDRRARLIQKLFEDEYRRTLASISQDASVLTMPVGTALCTFERTDGSSWATVDGVTHDHTLQLKLHRRTNHGHVESGTAEVVVRRHPLYPDVYELETLTVTDVMGVLDHMPLGAKKTVELCQIP